MQDPVIFAGTVRSNLDPFNSIVSDAQIWQALGRAGIKPAIEAMEVTSNLHKRMHFTTSAAFIGHSIPYNIAFLGSHADSPTFDHDKSCTLVLMPSLSNAHSVVYIECIHRCVTLP